MRSSLPLAACIILAAAPTVGHAQATKPLPPGVYFLWSPPGPRTVYVGQTLPNFDWVAQQGGRSNSYGLAMPRAMDADAEVRDAAYRVADHPKTSAFLGQMWFRLAPTTSHPSAPDLHLSGNDYVVAGAPVTLWISNESVTADDPIFVSVKVDPASGLAGDTGPIYATTTGAVPPGGFGSRLQVGIPALPAGAYLVSIEARDVATGRRSTSTRTLIVQ
ncbi:MAG: hypothetical protein WBC97_02550 [Gemmatimonadales bacterium]